MKYRDKVDVIVVGAGPSGLACAYTLAKSGVNVVVIERGDYPGAKNMFGGIFFSPVMEKLFPEYLEEAPWERFVSKRRFSILSGDSELAFEMRPGAFNTPPFNHSFMAKRAKMDRWFASKAEKAGANIICNYCVRDFLYEKGKIVGITSGWDDDSLLADIVICAEGANSILSEKAGLRKRIVPERRSIAVKEIIKLSPEVIEDRFCVAGKEGAALEFFGDSVKGLLGNGFIYTNHDSISVGVGFSLSDFLKNVKDKNPNDVLEDFKNHPAVRPYVKDGETIEYLAHMIPSDNYRNLPGLYRDGLMLVGDAAGLLNASFFHEGVNLAMASGIFAAETAIESIKSKDHSAEMLKLYKDKLDNSFVMKDMKNAKNFISFLYENKSIINDYPALFNDILVDYFGVSDKSKSEVKKGILKKVLKDVNKTKMASDMWGAFRNLV
ncbi:MAG: FAD-dependent oxidoreductase [Candidatus Omnitrophica bacterium]|nr:FAD-dependent oxidoreductase [Candidatus Omnitrophota bacterium]